MSSWQQLLQAFEFTKRAWNNEERKNLLTFAEIEEIEHQFFKFGEVLHTYNGTPQDYSRFMSEYTRLKRMIRRAETKMGYISIDY